MDSFSAPGDLLLAVVDACCACLDASSPLGAPGDCSVYWGQTAPPDDFFCDCSAGGFLAVWSEGIFPSSQFPVPFTQSVKSAVGSLQLVMPIAVRLVRPCWPVTQAGPSGTAVLPTRAETEPLSLNATMDMAILLCCVLGEFEAGADGIFGQCGNATAPKIVPDRNRGGCYGSSMRFAVSLGSCCIPPSGS